MPGVVRIGVLADTHVGDTIPRLPQGVCDALAGVDLILHAGDLTLDGVARQLESIAPVVAVRGNHDHEGRSTWPWNVRVRVGRHTIGLTHGHRFKPLEALAVILSLVTGRLFTLGLSRTLARRFGDADLVIFGHWHMLWDKHVGATRVYSPGAVYTLEADPALRHGPAVGGALARLRAMLPAGSELPAVAIIEVSEHGVEVQRVPVMGSLR